MMALSYIYEALSYSAFEQASFPWSLKNSAFLSFSSVGLSYNYRSLLTTKLLFFCREYEQTVLTLDQHILSLSICEFRFPMWVSSRNHYSRSSICLFVCLAQLTSLFARDSSIFTVWLEQDDILSTDQPSSLRNCQFASQYIKQLNDCSMKSVKNRDLLGTSNLHLQLSPENKTRTLSRSKASNEGGIRRQVLSPNSTNNLAESVAREVSISKASRGQPSVPFCSNLQQSRMGASPDAERSDILSKLQELMTMASSSAKQNHCKKQRSPGDEIYRKIEFNEWECDEIDKLKHELVKSYAKLKEVQKMHKETEKKTLQLQQSQLALHKEVQAWKDRSAKKDDIIFNLEQKIVKLLSENQALHEKVNELSMSIVQERNASIQNLKEHLLAMEKQGRQLTHTSIPANSSAQSTDQLRLKDQLQLMRLQIQSKDLLLKQVQENHQNQKHRLLQQIEVLRLQLQAYKSMPNVSPIELRKERERQEMYLLYIQASSIENLLKEKEKQQ